MAAKARAVHDTLVRHQRWPMDPLPRYLRLRTWKGNLPIPALQLVTPARAAAGVSAAAAASVVEEERDAVVEWAIQELPEELFNEWIDGINPIHHSRDR